MLTFEASKPAASRVERSVVGSFHGYRNVGRWKGVAGLMIASAASKRGSKAKVLWAYVKMDSLTHTHSLLGDVKGFGVSCLFDGSA
jgi:hypothetical protein